VAEPQSNPVPKGTAPTPPAVFAFQIVTSLLPASLQDVVFRTPFTIIVLIVGTIGLLAWIARRPAA
jgi:hypothetical protein